jgi:ATP-binding cassette subfamily B (MDR/TAP) protein 1
MWSHTLQPDLYRTLWWVSNGLYHCQRIFRYAGAFEYTIQAIAAVAAIASGAGIALQNLIWGQFVTVITDFSSGKSLPDTFLDDVAKLAYVLPDSLSET